MSYQLYLSRVSQEHRVSYLLVARYGNDWAQRLITLGHSTYERDDFTPHQACVSVSKVAVPHACC